MTWRDDQSHPFAGIAEKLKRSEQNILNLEFELDAFIKNGKYPVIPKKNMEEWEEAVSYHRDKHIPLRFAVLVGEIVHHLRSCLDHIVWYFSDSASRAQPNGIEFPIFKIKPTDKKEIERYTRKIKGIKDAGLLAMIEEKQPYQIGPDAANHRLLILHDMDRFDKHRELAIVDSGVVLHIPPSLQELIRKADLYNQGKLPHSEYVHIAQALQDHPVSPGVSFREFGDHRPYPVIKGLSQLHGAVDSVVDAFANKI